jgi:hypothetical protein
MFADQPKLNKLPLPSGAISKLLQSTKYWEKNSHSG